MPARWSVCAPRHAWCARAADWSGRRPTCSPTARRLESSRQPEFASPSIRTPTSTSMGVAMAQRGEEVMARFLGAENVERGQAYLEDLDAELQRYVLEFVYGEVYAGDTLDSKTRALCTVAMVACLVQQLQFGVYV